MAANDGRQERAARKRAQILHGARVLFVITVAASYLTLTDHARPVRR